MADYRDACDNGIYLLTSKIIYLFITNICFLITISPVILYFFSSGKNLSIPILTFVGTGFGLLIADSIGPVLSTMFSVVGNKKYFSKSLYLFF